MTCVTATVWSDRLKGIEGDHKNAPFEAVFRRSLICLGMTPTAAPRDSTSSNTVNVT